MAQDGIRSQSELMQRVISAAVLAAVAIGVAWLGTVPFAVVWGALAMAVAYEWGRIVRPDRAVALAVIVGLAALLSTFGFYVEWLKARDIIVLTLAVVLLGSVAMPGRWGGVGALYAFGMFLATVLVRGAAHDGFIAMMFLFAVVWMTDIGAYFSGRTFGGPKFAPRISPKKTWSGVVGGLVAGVACALLVLAVGGYTVGAWHFGLALVLSIAVVFGDLFESALKRKFGVKDAGSLIPGHGGFLDRLDGYVAAVGLAAIIGLWRGGFVDVAGGLIR